VIKVYDLMFDRYLVYAQIAVCAATLFTLVWACLAVRRRGLVFALFFFDLVTILHVFDLNIFISIREYSLSFNLN